MLSRRTGWTKKNSILPQNITTCIEEAQNNGRTRHLILHMADRISCLGRSELHALDVILGCDEMKGLGNTGYFMLATAMGIIEGSYELTGPLQYKPKK